MSKILIHIIAFSPDGVSTAYLYNDIAISLKEKGYEVAVITTTPHYNTSENDTIKQPLKRRFLGLYFESVFHGIKVKHIPQKKYKNTFIRIFGFCYWHIVALILGLFEENVDLIISPSPPLSIGLVNIIIGKLKGSKVIYNVQEIYPDLLIEAGGLRSKSIINLLKWLEKFVYKYSDKVTTIDKVFYDTIIPRFQDKSKLQVISNFVDTSIYKPFLHEQMKLNREYFPDNTSLKVMYAGNIGYAQDWETFIKTAVALKDEKIEFFIIGEGVMLANLKKEICNFNLENVHIIPYQPRDLMPFLIAYSDLQFIFMSPKTDGYGFPSKVYTIMACAKPLIVCSIDKTPIFNFLKDINCAYLIGERESNAKVNHIVNILKSVDRDELKKMGDNGNDIINLNYSKEVITGKYVELIESVLSE